MDLEDDFITENTKQGRLSVFCASTGGGKTHLQLSYVKMCMKYDIYETYIITSPTIEDEVDDKYSFLKNYKNVYYSNTWDMKYMSYVKGKTFIMIDDGTAILKDHRNDTNFNTMITTLRHKNITLFFGIHTLRSVLTPLIRQNIGYLFIGKFTNRSILEMVYEEYMSTDINQNDFMKMYNNSMKIKYNFIFIDCITNKIIYYNFDVSKWGILEFSNYKPVKNGKGTLIYPTSKEEQQQKKIKEQIKFSEMKEKAKPKKYNFKNLIFNPVKLK